MDLDRNSACVQRGIQPWGRDPRFLFFFEHMKDWLIIFPEGNVQQPLGARRQQKRAVAAAERSFVWLSYCGISTVVKSMCSRGEVKAAWRLLMSVSFVCKPHGF